MCKCCDRKIPQNTSTTFIFPPNGRRFVNGLSDSYDVKYYEQFKPYISELEFTHNMDRLLDGFNVMWPCDLCFYFGWICSVCTLGLSFLCPNICITDAHQSFLEDIRKFNENKFKSKHLFLSLQKRCCISWLQIDIIDQELNDHSLASEKEENKLIPSEIPDVDQA